MTYVLIALAMYHIYAEFMWQRERESTRKTMQQLLDRIQAKDLSEFKAFSPDEPRVDKGPEPKTDELVEL